MATPQELTDWYNAKNVVSIPPTLEQQSGLLNTPNQPTPTTVAPAMYTSAIANTDGYVASKQTDPTKWNVGSNETVAGNLDNILAKDSPLMQRAATTGLQTANSRGLLNSSLAAGEAQNSIIQNAMPIATTDATTYNRAAGYNVDTQNKIDAANVSAENTAKTFNTQAVIRGNEFNATSRDAAKSFNAQAANRANEFNATNAFVEQQDLFQANVKASMAQIESDAKFDQNSQGVYGQLSSDFQKAIMTINTDTNMNQQSKDYSINQMFNTYKAQVSMLSAIGTIPDISQLLVVSEPVAASMPIALSPPPRGITPRPATILDIGAGTAHWGDLNGNRIPLWN